MSPPPSLVDNSTLVGSVYASEQQVTLPGIVTHTTSRALRAPCWVLVLLVGLVDPLEALRTALSAVSG